MNRIKMNFSAKRSLLLAVLFFLFAAAGFGSYAKTNVGDYAVYRIVTSKMVVFERRTLVAKSGNNLRIKVETWFGKQVGEPMASREVIVPQNGEIANPCCDPKLFKRVVKPYFLVPGGPGVAKAGQEKLNINGKTLNCEVYKNKTATNWRSSNAPFDGLVKIEVNGKIIYELIGFGRND